MSATRHAYPLTEFPSAIPHHELSAAARLDPYWSGLWSIGGHAAWVSESLARRQVDSGIARLPKYLQPATSREPMDWVASPTRRPVQLGVLGVLDAWRTVTCEQLAAFVGAPALRTGRNSHMTDLFQDRLVDVGIFTNALWNTRHTPRGSLYRPSRTNAFHTDLEDRLTYPEWVAVTGGTPAESGGQFDRHNILAAELALRIGEYCADVGTILGEKHSSIDLLAHSGLGLPPLTGSQRAADLTLVRNDGLRIAIEMTASAGRTFDAKVRRWAELLSNRRATDSGLVVLFIVCDRQDKIADGNNELRHHVAKRIANAAREFPGPLFDRTAERMFMTEWKDWFPGPHQLDLGFLTLDCTRPNGSLESTWSEASLLDRFDVPFDATSPSATLAVFDNASTLVSVPYWLREQRPATLPLWHVTLARSGHRNAPTTIEPLHDTTSSGIAAEPPRRVRLPHLMKI